MNILILFPILLPIISAFIVYAFKDSNRKNKNILVISLVALTFIMCIVNALVETSYLQIIEISSAIKVILKVDNLSKLFSILISFVYLLVTIYTFEYIKHEKNENRFYTFYFLTLSMLISLTYSANIITMYICFEFTTLLSMPLVLHSLTKQSIAAAKKYLFYSIGGAFLALFGIFVLLSYSGDLLFTFNGQEYYKNFTGDKSLLLIAILSLVIGFGAKCGMFPLHGWLPTAHPVAPSPASAILSGVITKAGVISIIRIVYYFVGTEIILNTYVQYVWLSLAAFTVFMGSFMAYNEKLFKKRLAFSTVSQVSYILVGLALLNKVTFMGALIHVVAHMLIKVTLFLFAGKLIYKYDYHYVDQLEGIGIKLPISTWAYTFASLGLIGIPMTLGFVSKWYLATGSISSNIAVFDILIPIVLLVSAIFTAGYLLPITIKGFFVSKEEYKKDKCNLLMVIPMIIMALLVVIFGIYSEPIVQFITSIIGG